MPSPFVPQFQQPPEDYAPPEFPGYDPSERGIFNYSDGLQTVWGDPIAIRRRLDAWLGNVDKVLALCHAADWPGPDEQPEDWEPNVEAAKAAAVARGQLVEAVRDAFRMQPFDAVSGTGALEQECWDAFNAYHDFAEQKKSSSPTGAT